MPEVDPLILEIRLEAERARRELRDYASAAERRFEQMESRMRRSSEEIGSTFRNLAGTLAAAFSVQQIQQMADGYTRFTNQLRVAGLEGENLARGQEDLFQIAQKYGVELEAVGTLYSRAAQSATELRASQGDLLAVTEAVSASLKISGTSATEAQGALLQLSQALGSSIRTRSGCTDLIAASAMSAVSSPASTRR